jgi:hypothetical protein
VTVSLPTLHRRLGHVSPATICSFVCHHAIEGIELIDNDYPLFTCGSCDHAKTMRKAIWPERSTPPTTFFREEVHSDIWGPSPLTSLGRRCYYRGFIAWASTQHGATFCRLRSDHSSEYTSTSLMTVLQEQGIECRLTTHDTPQHNCVAESLNRCLLDRATRG